jgi:fucose permease
MHSANVFNKILHYPRLGLVILAYLAFIALGMPDGLLGVAWPSIRADFSLPLDALGSLLIFSTAGYLTSSSLSGRIVARWGIGRVLAASCLLTGAALLGYTRVPSWWMMVGLGIFSGLGAGAIDAGLNTYVASHFSEGLMQWLHASYGIGVTTGPIIMTLALSNFDSWRLGYTTVSGVQIALAICFLLTLPRWTQNSVAARPEAPRHLTDYQTPLAATLREPRFWLSLLQFFLYTGAEAGLGTWAYTLLTESRGVQPEAAGLLAGSYWAMFTVGRVVAGLYARRVGAVRLVFASLGAALLGSVLLWWNPTTLANLLAVGLIGLAIAPIFPGLVSGTSHRVGRQHASNTIGMQMAGAGLGAASIPGLMGILAQRLSLEAIPAVLAILFALLIGLFWLSEVKAEGDPDEQESR